MSSVPSCSSVADRSTANPSENGTLAGKRNPMGPARRTSDQRGRLCFYLVAFRKEAAETALEAPIRSASAHGPEARSHGPRDLRSLATRDSLRAFAPVGRSRACFVGVLRRTRGSKDAEGVFRSVLEIYDFQLAAGTRSVPATSARGRSPLAWSVGPEVPRLSRESEALSNDCARPPSSRSVVALAHENAERSASSSPNPSRFRSVFIASLNTVGKKGKERRTVTEPTAQIPTPRWWSSTDSSASRSVVEPS